ncbi:MAG TPA: SMI1/KNR4 family protein, partial [Cyclobacteriaceae bacterium]|nr:SMI1/KNR4 family protein [Cyclobacteriaceae bacterium]
IFKILKSYSSLGEETLKDGTILIGKAPHIAPMAWLHKIYPGLSTAEIGTLEKELGAKIPVVFKDFLQITNGLSVFNTTLCIYGLRKNYIRTIENVWQPFDIKTPNLYERPKGSKENCFFIGSYFWDGSKLYIDTIDNKVYRCSNNSSKPINMWNSFPDMLKVEIKRLCKLFDKDGKAIDGRIATTPPKN